MSDLVTSLEKAGLAKRVQEMMLQLGPCDWHAAVLELDHHPR
jgi:hypothetical protein